MSNSVYKVGQWIKHIQTGDLFEILYLYEGPGYKHVKIGKKFDSRSMSLYKAIYNNTIDFKQLQQSYELAPMAQVLLQYSNNK
jgi:hypothetical protein